MARENRAHARNIGRPGEGAEAALRRRVRPKGGSRHGLVIGVGEHSNPDLKLDFARADAEAVYQLMIDSNCGMFPKGNVQLLLDEKATFTGLRGAFSRLIREARENDVVWIYYAGHACRERDDIYWLLHDARLDDLYASAMSGDEVKRAFDKIGADRLIMFLDCCHAEAVSEDEDGTRAAETPLSVEEITKRYSGEGRMTIAASRSEERSVEDKTLRHGVFTYYLMKALDGEADEDGDGVVTASELWRYLPERVRLASKEAGCEHTPVLMGTLAGEVDLTINRQRLRFKKEIRAKLDEITGVSDGMLETPEANFCLEILEQGARTKAERLVESAFAGLVAGTKPLAEFRGIVQVAMQASDSRLSTPVPGRKVPDPRPPLRVELPRPEIVSPPEKPVVEGDMVRVVPVDAPPFYIGRHLVTNREYAEFLRHAASRKHTHCHEDEPPHKDHHPLGWSPETVGRYGDHPVAGVDWYDAYAYACWRGMRLPTVLEWEVAAGYDPSSASSRRFPWGEDPRSAGSHCNCWETRKPPGCETTTPVGSYPDGQSPWGCLDMAGNVWEWCVTGRGKARALKGGSFYKRVGYCPQELEVCYCETRDPEVRERDFGFRCCR